MARFNFSASEFDDFSSDYEPIPKGEYEMMMEEAEEKETASRGLMIKAKFRVLGPTHANRVIYNNYNVVNSNPKAEEISKRQLSTLCRAVGKPNAQDTDELLNLPFIGVVSIEPGRGEYGPQNRIDGYKSKSGNAPAAQKTSPAPSQSPAAVTQPAPAPAQTAPVASAPAPASHSEPKKAPWEV